MFTPFTFARRELRLEEADYAVLGVPYDSSQSYRTGSRFAPTAIREASREIEDYDMQEGLDLLDLKICDVGDVEVSFGSFKETLARTKASVEEVLKHKVVPVVLGGEHIISYCVVSAFEKKPFFLAFDAHLDFKEEYLDNRFSHACAIRRTGELVGYENVLVVGVRSASKKELGDAKDLGLEFIGFDRCGDAKALAEDISNRIEGKDIYLSIDIDVLDPKEARGACNPEPPGLEYRAFVACLDFLKKADMVGLDLTEVCPFYDSYSRILAAKLIFKVLAKNEK